MNLNQFKGLAVAAVLFAGGAFIRSGGMAAKGVKIPDPGLRFVDVTDVVGLDYEYKEAPLDPKIQGKMRMFFFAPGAAIADYDGDGWMDLLVTSAGRGSRNRLYLNQRGKGFKEVGAAWG